MSYMETATYQLFVLGLLQLAEYFLQLLTPNAIRNSYDTGICRYAGCCRALGGVVVQIRG